MLQLLHAYSGLDKVPAALSGLSRLRLCQLECADKDHAPLLPGGPWLHSLEWLGASIGTLLRSTAVLQAAARLEHVSVDYSSDIQIDWNSPAAAALFYWLAHHPPLLSFSVNTWGSQFAPADFTAQMVRLGHCCPALRIQLPGLGHECETFDDFLRAQNPF